MLSILTVHYCHVILVILSANVWERACMSQYWNTIVQDYTHVLTICSALHVVTGFEYEAQNQNLHVKYSKQNPQRYNIACDGIYST